MGEFYESAKGNIKNIFAVRFKPETDILKGIEDFCTEKNIKNGFIMSAIGSLRNAKFCDPQKVDTKLGYGYGKPIEINDVVEVISISGLICHDDNNNVLSHIHISLADKDGTSYGGHLVYENYVLATVDMIIAEIDGISMERALDKELELPLFHPVEI